MGLSWCISLSFHIEYVDFWVEEAVRLFVRALPYYWFVQNITDWTEAKKIMYYTSIFTVLIMLIYAMIGWRMGTLFQEGYVYSQFNGMIMAGATTLSFIAFFDEKKWGYLFITLFGLGLLFLWGARMPILCVGIGFLLIALENLLRLKKNGMSISRKGFFILLLIVLGSILSLFILEYLKLKKMTYIDGGQRIIYMLINGGFFKSDGRLDVYVAALKGILDHPLRGYGIIADRIPVAVNLNYATNDFPGTYAHNIILELCLQYGVLLGGFLILFILVATFKLVLDRRMEWDKKVIAIYAVSMTYGVLLLSSPTYSHKEFWIMMGLGASYFRKKRRERSKTCAGLPAL